MGRSIKTTKLNKDYILKEVSQITIFSTYLGITPELIQHCIDTGELITSPLREDVHPTCGFRYDVRGKLKFKDFSGHFWGDCFDLVAFVMSSMYRIEINISNKSDFIKVLRHITFVFKDIFYGEEKDENLIKEISNTIGNIKRTKSIIELVVRNWNENDKEYWNKIGVPLSFLNINFIYPVEQYYINRKVNPEPKYYYKSDDPCYGYLLGQDKQGINNIKLYFPKRGRDNTRFITNCNHIEGVYNLNKNNYDIIVITKSTKDRVCIGATLERIKSLYGGGIINQIGVINLPHETYKLRENEYQWLYNKLSPNGQLVSLMDNDRVGKIETIWLRDTYNITPILIPKSYNAKDFSELITKVSFKEIYQIIIKTINNINEYVKNRNFNIGDIQKDDTLPY